MSRERQRKVSLRSDKLGARTDFGWVSFIAQPPINSEFLSQTCTPMWNQINLAAKHKKNEVERRLRNSRSFLYLLQVPQKTNNHQNSLWVGGFVTKISKMWKQNTPGKMPLWQNYHIEIKICASDLLICCQFVRTWGVQDWPVCKWWDLPHKTMCLRITMDWVQAPRAFYAPLLNTLGRKVPSSLEISPVELNFHIFRKNFKGF